MFLIFNTIVRCSSYYSYINNHLSHFSTIVTTRRPTPRLRYPPKVKFTRKPDRDDLKVISRVNLTSSATDGGNNKNNDTEYEYYYYYYYDFIYPDELDDDEDVIEHLPKPSYFSAEVREDVLKEASAELQPEAEKLTATPPPGSKRVLKRQRRRRKRPRGAKSLPLKPLFDDSVDFVDVEDTGVLPIEAASDKGAKKTSSESD